MRRERARTAALIALPVLILALVVAVGALALLAKIGPVPDGGASAGLARVGNDLALVIVTDGAASIAGARELVVRWGLVIPLVTTLATLLLAWGIAGRLEHRIRLAERSIDDADRQRRTHLREVVHELRTPLAVISTNLELAGPQNADKEKYLDAARRAISRMAHTVDDLDSHGRLTVGEGGGRVDLSETARAAGVEVVALGQEHDVSIVVADKPAVFVEGIDEAAIRACLGNFLANAIRYAPRSTAITIDWGTHLGWAWLSVSDDGVGIAPQLHARVFERGWQGDHARDRHEGSGLGLAIARQMTEAQGGMVTVDSEEGRGATFTAWLPHNPGAVATDILAPDGVHPLARPWRLVHAS